MELPKFSIKFLNYTQFKKAEQAIPEPTHMPLLFYNQILPYNLT